MEIKQEYGLTIITDEGFELALNQPQVDQLLRELVKEIYVVTGNEYSDYHVVGATLSRKEAEILAAEEYLGRVESYNPHKISEASDRLNNGYKFYRVYMDRDGNSRLSEVDFKPSLVSFSGIKEFATCVWAKTPEHAVKIVNERRTFILAKNLWGTGYLQIW